LLDILCFKYFIFTVGKMFLVQTHQNPFSFADHKSTHEISIERVKSGNAGYTSNYQPAVLISRYEMTDSKSPDLSYDLESMSPVEEQQFWYEFETMLRHARDGKSLPLSKVNIINSVTRCPSDAETTLH
jgi:hypothetical protein